jgi:hypothetical protein
LPVVTVEPVRVMKAPVPLVRVMAWSVMEMEAPPGTLRVTPPVLPAVSVRVRVVPSCVRRMIFCVWEFVEPSVGMSRGVAQKPPTQMG